MFSTGDAAGRRLPADAWYGAWVERLKLPISLQTFPGYLTIVGERLRGERSFYELGYPNREVRESLNGSLLRATRNVERFDVVAECSD